MRMWQRHLLLAASLMVCGAAQSSSPITPHTEYFKRIRTGEMVSPLTSELFGEKISLASRSTEFVVTDIDLPGNDALPVRLQRRLAVQSFKDRDPWGGFGSWDVDIPHIQGTFTLTDKWNVSSNGATQRCGQLFTPKVPTVVNTYEVWSGNTAHIPGESDQELLYIGGAATNPRPTDGAVYNWGTRGSLRFSCLPATANGYPGEGFLGVDGNGNRYFFNVGAERRIGALEIGQYVIGMVRVYLLASRVEDRHGNWVAYDYAGDKLTGIRGSDGRSIAINYAGDRIVSATAHGRTWNYEYNERTSALGFSQWPSLRAVVQPDGTRIGYEYSWQDSGYGGLNPEYGIWDGNPQLCTKPGFEASSFTLVATHPAGTRGQFDFTYVRNPRTGIPQNACGTVGGRYYQRVAPSIDVYAIKSKTLSGPGLAPQTWTYERGGYDSGIVNSSTTTVVEPDGTRHHHVFGIKVDENEGQLLQQAVTAPDGTLVQVTTNTYMTAAEAALMPFPDSNGMMSAADDTFSTRNRPLKRTVLGQDGVNFVSETNAFDALVRPVTQTESNSLGSARVLGTTYFDDTGRWILGQVARSTQAVGGVEIETERTEFDALARPQRTYAFGLLQQTIGYHADGTVASVADGRGNTIQFAGWKRGLPQQTAFPDGSGLQLQVDDNGWVGTTLEPNGASRTYQYDAMGRITAATQAAGDSVAWNTTTSHFFLVAGSEVGLEGGHWKRESSTGSARAVTYYDGLWRPVLDEKFDANDRAGTLQQNVTRYDNKGQPIFRSYPTRSASDFRSALPGTYTAYDALGRAVRSESDSELGRLVTTTQYLGGGAVRTTNPRGMATTTTFLMYGKPSEDLPITIAHPEGAFTEVQRDALGKPLAIVRRNGDGSVSVRRQYVYDPAQRLCKTMEPETGATVVGYDAAGNVIWSAAGLTLLGPQCDSETAWASSSRADRGYDSMNRLLTLRFSDGQGDQDWSYWPGGKVRRVQTRNGGALTVNEYAYNLRDLLTGETVVYDGGLMWSLGYGYDANGALSTILQPSGRLIDYGPNALGQPTRAGTFASNVRYYANGGMSSFTYGNGVTHQMIQNARGLPDRSQDQGSAGVVIDDGYDYDANGNVAAISDGLPGAPGNREMTYDGLDRLTSVAAPGFGNASYAYDVLDNIVAATVGVRRQTFEYDFSNRLSNVRDIATGASVAGLGYDPQGNLRIRNGVDFRFDYGNRLREVVGKESYQYDAHGRRTQASAASGDIRSMYGQDGVLRYQHNQREAKGIDYVHLNGSLVAKVSGDIAPAALVVRVPGYSADGAYSVQWDAAPGALRYEIQEATGATWQDVYQGSALSVGLSGRAAGTYIYRGRTCNVVACGAWSVQAAIRVRLPPGGAPSLSAPAQGILGNYTVSWTSTEGASSYALEEFAGLSWSALASGEATSHSLYGKAPGNYRYRVRACNPEGCGDYSNEAAVVALHPPGNPSLGVPQASYTGAYILQVSSGAQTSSVRIEQQFNGGAWAEINRVSGTQLAITGRGAGTYGYRGFACNEAGCSAASAVVSILVTLPPTTAPGLSLGGASYSSSISMSWNPIPVATYYQVVEQLNGGGFGVVQESGATAAARSGLWPGAWGYMVRGCNVGGCGPWSAVATVQIIGPPAVPQMHAPATSGIGAAYTVHVLWGVPEATGYQIDESSDGVNWTLISHTDSVVLNKALGGTYHYRGRACNPAGCSPSSAAVTVAVAGAPPVPTGLRITRSTTTQCSLVWNLTPTATSYDVRSLNVTYSTTGAGYDFDSACQRPYKVRACNALACSAWSGGI